MNHTVDGKNPAPVDMANKNIPLFTRFYTSQVLQVVFHQQYEPTYRIHKKSCHKKYHAGDKVVNICILNNTLL